MPGDLKTTDRLQTRETMSLSLIRQRPRCDCGGIIYASNCTCGSCGKVTIVPEAADGKA